MSRSPDIEDLLREAAPQVLAAVVRQFGDFSNSEDAVQEALVAAVAQWPVQGTCASEPDARCWGARISSRRWLTAPMQRSSSRAVPRST